MTALRILFTLLANAVPLVGIAYLHWSATAVVVLYWYETLLGFLLTSARIALHRKLTRKRGHWRIPMLRDHLLAALVVVPALGVFVAVFVFMASEMAGVSAAFSLRDFEHGALSLSLVMAIEFVSDALLMRARSFGWMRAYTERRGGSLLVMFFVVLLGLPALHWTRSPFAVVYVMMALKILWDVFSATSLSQHGGLAAQPAPWMLKLADWRVQSTGGAEVFKQRWARDQAKAQADAAFDEQVMPSDGAPLPPAADIGSPAVMAAAPAATAKVDATAVALALRGDFANAAKQLGFQARFPNFQRRSVRGLEMLAVDFDKQGGMFRIFVGLMPAADIGRFRQRWLQGVGVDLAEQDIIAAHCSQRGTLRSPDGDEWFRASAGDSAASAVLALHAQIDSVLEGLAV
jgi:hypothetical protein